MTAPASTEAGVLIPVYWWAGAESNCHSRRRGFYRPLGSPPAQPTHAADLPAGVATPRAAASLPVSERPRPRPDRQEQVGEVVEMRGLEPLTPAMRTRCSPS